MSDAEVITKLQELTDEGLSLQSWTEVWNELTKLKFSLYIIRNIPYENKTAYQGYIFFDVKLSADHEALSWLYCSGFQVLSNKGMFIHIMTYYART